MPSDGTLRLLIVEDSIDDRDLLLRALRTSGLRFEWRAVSTLNAFSDALEESWSAVLCDFHLSGFDALSALSMVRQRQLDVPFIIVSGVLGEEAAVSAMKAGAHDFFAKGKLARLSAAIEREVAEARTRSARRQAEAENAQLLVDLQRALGVRDEFLVLASHELRTPLTVLRLQVDALARSSALTGVNNLGATGNRVALLQRQVGRFAALVDRLLDVTELASGAVRLVPAEVDLERVVLDVVERSRDWIDESGCSLSLEPMESVTGSWDPVRLDGIVTNLLANAIKYGVGKPVRISVERSGDRAVLSVRDQGIGMSAEEQASLFQKFARAVPPDNYGGLGLGLWIVDRLARAHGGNVRIESRKGEGATFTVDLPAQPQP
jgi:signal transduction histidine kinase